VQESPARELFEHPGSPDEPEQNIRLCVDNQLMAPNSQVTGEQVTALQDAAVRHYLETGEHDPNVHLWRGDNFMEAEIRTDKALRGALIAVVKNHSDAVPNPPIVAQSDFSAMTRSKIAPMVNGLFPKTEQAQVIALLERSAVFLTTGNIETVLTSAPWLSTAWDLANLYLASIGAKALSPQASAIVGLSEETTCYVSIEYLLDPNPEPFSDYLVHEAAHVFHNCRREPLGLKHSRNHRYLLEIHYRMRETFAYCCEAYSRILVLGDTPARRLALLEQHAADYRLTDDSVDPEEYQDILREAVMARNGWKHILKRCSINIARGCSQTLILNADT